MIGFFTRYGFLSDTAVLSMMAVSALAIGLVALDVGTAIVRWAKSRRKGGGK